jgi:hypothetical protein
MRRTADMDLGVKNGKEVFFRLGLFMCAKMLLYVTKGPRIFLI